MENQLIELKIKIKIEELIKENNALKSKMMLMYYNWHFDFERFTELTEKCKLGFRKTEIKTENDKISIRK